jgi:hypothetical protein
MIFSYDANLRSYQLMFIFYGFYGKKVWNSRIILLALWFLIYYCEGIIIKRFSGYIWPL